ncbi:MAG: hypothetical protein MO846_06955, partial [Candidatus Devosia symbiotica]|nr:hypothetical protein [Candidatus Devosia symbiotica]
RSGQEFLIWFRSIGLAYLWLDIGALFETHIGFCNAKAAALARLWPLILTLSVAPASLPTCALIR